MGRPKKSTLAKVKTPVTTKANKTSFVDRALAASKEKNPENIGKFQERVIRHADREIQAIEDKLIDAKAAIDDADALVAEVSLQINLSEISSVGSINSYIPKYVSSIEDAINAKNAKVKAVEAYEMRISFFNTLKGLVK